MVLYHTLFLHTIGRIRVLSAGVDSIPFPSPCSDRRCVRHLDSFSTDVTTALASTRPCLSVTRSYLILVYISSLFLWPLELASPNPYISIYIHKYTNTWKEKASIIGKEGKNRKRKERNVTEKNGQENEDTREENATRCRNTDMGYSSRGCPLRASRHID